MKMCSNCNAVLCLYLLYYKCSVRRRKQGRIIYNQGHSKYKYAIMLATIGAWVLF